MIYTVVMMTQKANMNNLISIAISHLIFNLHEHRQESHSCTHMQNITAPLLKTILGETKYQISQTEKKGEKKRKSTLKLSDVLVDDPNRLHKENFSTSKFDGGLGTRQMAICINNRQINQIIHTIWLLCSV